MKNPITDLPLRKATWFGSDEQFHHLYPLAMQQLARRHWTSLAIAEKVVQFLTPSPGVKVLDIGSGVGKFCLTGAYHQPSAHFFGIEQREDLVAHANTARDILGLQNVHFIHGNFTQLDFSQYDHFYFYNSFYEHLTDTDKIDNNITFSTALYNYYTRYLYKKLDAMPAGTRLATFHTMEDRVPPGFCLAESHVGTLLKFWVKT
ncbi:methyltransferase domain-containing protein [Pseudoflavitalea sp. X16]|uniref:methyltransferase domain-containing protein n=1 Tax=Paraflavitalea devenefica TaxID=2716334 RepID=UPI00141DDC06|nr:methyltransferase domain-containing protein [Paraflavitalea devenefica]NII27833.1 methyltransferase domain-containing protein [Paraflavitalea devenefica]